MTEYPGGVYPLLRAIGHVLDDKKFRTRHGEDAHGWFDAAVLCALLREFAPEYSTFDEAQLRELYVTLNTARQRMELIGERVRARFPSNFRGQVTHRPPLEEVPDLLYFSAPVGDTGRIQRDGAAAQRGSLVPLAGSVDDAQDRAISLTSNRETVFIVDTRVVRAAGIAFFVVNDDQYLAELIPASALSVWVEQPIDPPVITLEQARAIAEEVMLSDAGDIELKLVGPVDRPRHWVWRPSAVDPVILLAGGSAIAVSKLDGRVRRLWSGRAIEEQV